MLLLDKEVSNTLVKNNGTENGKRGSTDNIKAKGGNIATPLRLMMKPRSMNEYYVSPDKFVSGFSDTMLTTLSGFLRIFRMAV